MKKFVLAIAALGVLAACNNTQKQNKTPVMVEEEEMVITTSEPRPVNMRDSLVMENGKGTVIERQYSGLLPAADGPGIEYDLTLFFQEDSEGGVYAMNMTYIEAEDGQDRSFPSYGKRKIEHGIKGDNKAIVYTLIPNNGDEDMSFVLTKEGNLTLLDQNKERIDSPHNYTLKLIK